MLFFSRKDESLTYTNLSKTCAMCDNADIGRQLLQGVLSPAINSGVTRAILTSGKTLSANTHLSNLLTRVLLRVFNSLIQEPECYPDL